MYSFYVFSLSPHSHVYLKLHSERAILPLQLYSFNGLFFFFSNSSCGLRKLILRLAADYPSYTPQSIKCFSYKSDQRVHCNANRY